jgi:hypothetical protein
MILLVRSGGGARVRESRGNELLKVCFWRSYLGAGMWLDGVVSVVVLDLYRLE